MTNSLFHSVKYKKNSDYKTENISKSFKEYDEGK